MLFIKVSLPTHLFITGFRCLNMGAGFTFLSGLGLELPQELFVFLGSCLGASVTRLIFCTLGVLFTFCYPEPSLQRAAIVCPPWGLGMIHISSSLALSFQWVPALPRGRPCVPQWGSSSAFFLGFHPSAHYPLVLGKGLWERVGWYTWMQLWLGLLGMLISDAVFKSSLKIELIYLYLDLADLYSFCCSFKCKQHVWSHLWRTHRCLRFISLIYIFCIISSLKHRDFVAYLACSAC